MKVEINTLPRFSIFLNVDQASILHKWALLHYDSACRSAAMAQDSGFINGWKNHTLFSEEEQAPCNADWRRCDIVLKITESTHGIPGDEASVLQEIHQLLRKAMGISHTLTSQLITMEL